MRNPPDSKVERGHLTATSGGAREHKNVCLGANAGVTRIASGEEQQIGRARSLVGSSLTITDRCWAARS